MVDPQHQDSLYEKYTKLAKTVSLQIKDLANTLEDDTEIKTIFKGIFGLEKPAFVDRYEELMNSLTKIRNMNK